MSKHTEYNFFKIFFVIVVIYAIVITVAFFYIFTEKNSNSNENNGKNYLYIDYSYGGLLAESSFHLNIYNDGLYFYNGFYYKNGTITYGNFTRYLSAQQMNNLSLFIENNNFFDLKNEYISEDAIVEESYTLLIYLNGNEKEIHVRALPEDIPNNLQKIEENIKSI